jgi:hypothetical protein
VAVTTTWAAGPDAVGSIEVSRVGGREIVRWQTGAGARMAPLLAEPDDGSWLLDGLIFHISRCGSTLLARLLATAAGTVVLNEPPFLNRLLADRDRGTLHQRALMRRMLATCRAEIFPTAGAVVVKTTSWNLLHGALLVDAFPEATNILLTRDPVEVLVSLVEHPPAWLEADPESAAALAERAAIRVARYFDAATALVDDRWFPVRYEDLPPAAEHVMAALGRTADFDPDVVESVAAKHSKRSDQPWQPDGAAKRARASQEAQAAARRHVAPAHARLQAALAATRADHMSAGLRNPHGVET